MNEPYRIEDRVLYAPDLDAGGGTVIDVDRTYPDEPWFAVRWDNDPETVVYHAARELRAA